MKLYYDYPIDAAHMNKEFGVIILPTPCYDGLRDCYEAESIVFEAFQCTIKAPYYVHQDSHDIFKPQIGDSVLIRIECDIKGESDIVVDYEDILEGAWGEEVKVKEIMLRNGKRFFMPKIEEA